MQPGCTSQQAHLLHLLGTHAAHAAHASKSTQACCCPSAAAAAGGGSSPRVWQRRLVGSARGLLRAAAAAGLEERGKWIVCGGCARSLAAAHAGGLI
jgi:hypothetical protein